jgi:hypothetical protein
MNPIFKSMLGLGGGALLGYCYHMTMRCTGSVCINSRIPAVPIGVMAVIGLLVALNSRP